MIKIAIPSKNDQVDNHFGHCAYFTVYSVDDQKQVTRTGILNSGNDCGCKSNLAEELKNEGISVMLAGGIGQGAIQKLRSQQIEVIPGFSGPVDAAVQNWAQGHLPDQFKICTDHEHGHGHSCSHH